MAIRFAVVTEPVRLANTDDVLFQAAASGTHGESVRSLFDRKSAEEGRFYFRLGIYRLPYAIYSIKNEAMFSATRAALLLLQLGMLGYLLAYLHRSEAVGLLFVVISFGALHLPSIFYPVLSYPAYSTASAASLFSLIAFLKWRDHPNAPHWLAFACLFFLYSLICHENFVLCALLFPCLDWATRPSQPALRVVMSSLPILAIAGAYVAIYAAFRGEMAIAYDGTRLSLHPFAAARSWMLQTLAALPGTELFLHRGAPYPTVGPVFKTREALAAVILATPVWDIALALLAACLATFLAVKASSHAQTSKRIVCFLTLAAVLPNVLPSFTEKFQEDSHHRFYPYVYSFSAYCWIMAAIVCLLPLLVNVRLRGAGARRSQIWPAFACFLLLFLSAAASNTHTVHLLVTWFN